MSTEKREYRGKEKKRGEERRGDADRGGEEDRFTDTYSKSREGRKE